MIDFFCISSLINVLFSWLRRHREKNPYKRDMFTMIRVGLIIGLVMFFKTECYYVKVLVLSFISFCNIYLISDIRLDEK